MPEFEVKIPKAFGGHIDAIDELKGAAILLIVLYHAGGVLVWQNLLHGDVGVDLFVILSGVGLALSSRVESAGAFLKRRLLRIYPVYWIVLALFLWANAHFLNLTYSKFNIAVHFLGVQAWFGDAIGLGVNDSFWFITLIVSLYLVYALLRPFLARPDIIVLCGGVLSAVVSYTYFLTGQSACFGHVALRLPGFFGGLLVGSLLKDGHIGVRLSPALAVGLVALVYVPYTHGIIFYSDLAAFSLAIGYIFLWRQRAPARLVSATSGFLRFFGTYSLEIFLIHQPLIRDYNYYVRGRLFNDVNPSAMSLFLGMLIGLGITLIISIELHRVLERFSLFARGRQKAA